MLKLIWHFILFFVSLRSNKKDKLIMTREEYEALMAKYAQQIEHIRKMAHELHQSVDQTYCGELP